MIDTIEGDVNEAELHIDGGRKHLLTAHQRESKNRPFIIKVFACLYVVSTIYIVVLSWLFCLLFKNNIIIQIKVLLIRYQTGYFHIGFQIEFFSFSCIFHPILVEVQGLFCLTCNCMACYKVILLLGSDLQIKIVSLTFNLMFRMLFRLHVLDGGWLKVL